MDLMEVSRRMYSKKGTVIVSCVRNLYINRRALLALFVYSSSCSRVRWRNWQNITTLRIRTVDSHRSFIYLLSYLSLHAIVLQIYWSRVVASWTPPMPMHDSFSSARELKKCTHIMWTTSSSRWNPPENENGFPPVTIVEKCARDCDRAPFSGAGRKSRYFLILSRYWVLIKQLQLLQTHGIK